jgi:two-component system chemotaxis sensor kinase CheA
VADEVLQEFMAELAELLSMLERDLVSVDAGRNPAEVVPQTFRVFHTVKGTAGFLGFDRLREVSHAAEDLLAGIRDGSIAWTRPVTDVLLQVLDALRVMMDEIARTEKDGTEAYAPLVGRLREAAGETPPAPASAPSPPAAAPPPGVFLNPNLAPGASPSATPEPPPAPIFQPARAAGRAPG